MMGIYLDPYLVSMGCNTFSTTHFISTHKCTPLVFFPEFEKLSRHCNSILQLIFLRIFVRMDHVMLNLGM